MLMWRHVLSQICTDVSEQSVVSIFHDAGFSKTLILMYQITRRHVPEDSHRNTALRIPNLKFLLNIYTCCPTEGPHDRCCRQLTNIFLSYYSHVILYKI